MGYYVNPRNMEKEQFLETKGTSISELDFLTGTFNKFRDNNLMVVIWVNNGPFTAALICYSQEEYKYMLDNPDHRPKKYYTVPVQLLEEFL